MIESAVLVLVLLAVATVVMLGILLRRRSVVDLSPLLARMELQEKLLDRTERGFKDEIARLRGDGTENSRALREEVQTNINALSNTLTSSVDRISRVQKERLEEVSNGLGQFKDSLQKQFTDSATLQKQQFDSFAASLERLTESNQKKSDELRALVEAKLIALQTDNAAKIEEMRRTVDEKLQGALEKRLGESFKQVSERLEAVHKGLGEMQTLASGVGDLKRVLTNVKTRGTWGEMQLGNLLEQILAPDQFARNVCTTGVGRATVEFAIKLPGRDDKGGPVWLPIDAKFPKEDYERLVEATERGDIFAIETAAKDLETRVKAQARDIKEKYLAPPATTDFGLLYLPTEGLYAEVIRRPGLVDTIQREQRVVVVGPTTLAALLNSLQMGFRTLAIQKRSSEVWTVLASVQNEFGKFGEILDKVKKKLDEAGNVIEDAATRRRAVERALKTAEALPAPDARAQLPLSNGELPFAGK